MLLGIERESREVKLNVKALDIVYAAIDQVNAQTEDGPRIEKSPEMPLLGGDGGVDSLTLVNLFATVEQQIEMQTGKAVVLVDDSMLTVEDSPFRTVGTLAGLVEKLLTHPA